MDISQLKQLFPTLEEGLYQEMLEHGAVREVKAGETLLKVGQPIRSIMLY
jgi:CRP/FNR family transcriptional regulator